MLTLQGLNLPKVMAYIAVHTFNDKTYQLPQSAEQLSRET